MSKRLFNKIIKEIDSDKYHLYFEGDKENFLSELEDLYTYSKLTDDEYEELLIKVEQETEDIPNCLWEDMKRCNPDLSEQ